MRGPMRLESAVPAGAQAMLGPGSPSPKAATVPTTYRVSACRRALPAVGMAAVGVGRNEVQGCAGVRRADQREPVVGVHIGTLVADLTGELPFTPLVRQLDRGELSESLQPKRLHLVMSSILMSM